jgi:hypothetical protein
VKENAMTEAERFLDSDPSRWLSQGGAVKDSNDDLPADVSAER